MNKDLESNNTKSDNGSPESTFGDFKKAYLEMFDEVGVIAHELNKAAVLSAMLMDYFQKLNGDNHNDGLEIVWEFNRNSCIHEMQDDYLRDNAIKLEEVFQRMKKNLAIIRTLNDPSILA